MMGRRSLHPRIPEMAERMLVDPADPKAPKKRVTWAPDVRQFERGVQMLFTFPPHSPRA